MMFGDNNAVLEARDGEVVLVGEDHRTESVYRNLARSVITEYEPQTIAIEAPSVSSLRKCAMREAKQYARSTGKPLLAVDTVSNHLIPTEGVDLGKLRKLANMTNVQEDGSYSEKTERRTKRAAHELYGTDAAEGMWDERERLMAGRIIDALERGFPSPIMLACGLYHLKAIKERLDDPDHERHELSNYRIWRPDQQDAQSTKPTM